MAATGQSRRRVKGPGEIQSYQYVRILADVEARMCLNNLLDRRSRICLWRHYREGIPVLLL